MYPLICTVLLPQMQLLTTHSALSMTPTLASLSFFVDKEGILQLALHTHTHTSSQYVLARAVCPESVNLNFFQCCVTLNILGFYAVEWLYEKDESTAAGNTPKALVL